jgi:hypothetical protein
MAAGINASAYRWPTSYLSGRSENYKRARRFTTPTVRTPLRQMEAAFSGRPG